MIVGTALPNVSNVTLLVDGEQVQSEAYLLGKNSNKEPILVIVIKNAVKMSDTDDASHLGYGTKDPASDATPASPS